jgi:Holliday junction resolvasome RuvABC ATP-dependent DNA helicase subunit
MEENSVGTDVNQIKLTSLSNIHGQPQVTNNLNVHINAHFNIQSESKSTGSFFGPVLLTGSSGTGKTMTAKAIHAELGNLHMIETNGVTMNAKAELYSTFLNADNNTTIFIDEVHGMSAKTQLILLTVLSERTLRVPTIHSNYYTKKLANFTVILATTHEYMLLPALRNRMRIECRFKNYSAKDLCVIVRQRADNLLWKYESDEVLEIIAQRAKGNPRQALHRNLQMCWNVAKSRDRNTIMLTDVDEAFHYLQIDELGLKPLDRAYLNILYEHGPSALGVLSSRLSLPPLTVHRIIEPYLLKEGFIVKDKSSVRIITEKGRKHIETTSFCLNDGE